MYISAPKDFDDISSLLYRLQLIHVLRIELNWTHDFLILFILLIKSNFEMKDSI